MKILIINLDRCPDRKAHMLNQIHEQGLSNFEFIDAVDGLDYEPADTLAACMESHRKAWKHIVSINEPCLVLEDDTMLYGSFLHNLTDRYTPAKEYFEVGLIGYQLKGTPLWNTVIKNWRFAQKDAVIEFNGAYAYIVNGGAAARKLLRLSEEVPHHPDLMIMDEANRGNLSLFFLVHPLVQHGSFATTLAHPGLAKPVHQPVSKPKPVKGKPQPQNGKPAAKGGKLRLFINYYEAKTETRNEELLRSLFTNQQSGLFDEIINLGDTPAPAPDVRTIALNREPTYADYFAQIKKLAGPDDVSVIANLDIYFDGTILYAKDMPAGDAYALTRYDIKNGKPVYFGREDSQDVWIIRGKPKAVKGADFTLGVPGCDNRIAQLLADAGYNVRNPSHSILTYHLHESNQRRQLDANGDRTMPAVKGKYLLVKGTKL